jgi:hypothetical protein
VKEERPSAQGINTAGACGQEITFVIGRVARTPDVALLFAMVLGADSIDAARCERAGRGGCVAAGCRRLRGSGRRSRP